MLNAALLGALGVVLTFGGRKATEAIVRLTAGVSAADSKIVAVYKGFQPAIATVLGFVLPSACQAIGLSSTCPSADALAGAPLGVIGGITVLELWRKVTGKPLPPAP